MKVRGVCVLVALGMLLVAAGGCENKELTRLRTENADLRIEVDSLQATNESLSAELAQTRSALSDKDSALVDAHTQLEDLRARMTGTGATVVMREGMPTIVLPQRVTFASGKADLTSEGKDVLAKVAAALKDDFAGQPVRVEGHTDTDPIKKTKHLYRDNWDLGAERAMAVVRYLQQAGIAPERLSAATYSMYRPISDKKDENRRVEVVVIPKD